MGNKSRYTTFNNPIGEKKNPLITKSEMSVIKESGDDEEEKDANNIKPRKSESSLSSTDSLNEEDNNERFINIVTRFRRNTTNFYRGTNTVFESKVRERNFKFGR